MNLPPLEERIQRLLELVAENQRPCSACGRHLYFVRMPSGKLAPFTVDGVNHFIDCVQRDRFRRKGAVRAQAADA